VRSQKSEIRSESGNSHLLLDAHCDEVGFVITESLEGGFCKFALLGSVDLRTLPGAEVWIETLNSQFGVICALPPHLTGNSDKKIYSADDLLIDTGGIAVEVGSFGVFASNAIVRNDFTRAKSLDNRASCAVLLDVLKRLKNADLSVDLSLLFSTQEEVGLRGAKVGAYNSNADFAVVVDVTFGEAPNSKGFETFPLGQGVTIAVGANMNRAFTQKLRNVAERHCIPYKIEVLAERSGTNAEVVQLARSGIATALISIPLRYMHSPVEVAHTADLQNASDLLYYLVTDWEK